MGSEKSTRSGKKIGNGHLVTQIGLEDRDGDASEEHLCVSVDVEVENSKNRPKSTRSVTRRLEMATW